MAGCVTDSSVSIQWPLSFTRWDYINRHYYRFALFGSAYIMTSSHKDTINPLLCDDVHTNLSLCLVRDCRVTEQCQRGYYKPMGGERDNGLCCLSEASFSLDKYWLIGVIIILIWCALPVCLSVCMYVSLSQSISLCQSIPL